MMSLDSCFLGKREDVCCSKFGASGSGSIILIGSSLEKGSSDICKILKVTPKTFHATSLHLLKERRDVHHSNFVILKNMKERPGAFHTTSLHLLKGGFKK